MKTKSEAIESTGEVQKLRRDIRRLQWCVFVVWPIVFVTGCAILFAASGKDADAARVTLSWIESLVVPAIFIGIFVGVVVGGIAFLAKVATDFRNRNYRVSLNPGSRPSTDS